MVTLVHFHLVNPIMVGKKKTNDVQFYTEARPRPRAALEHWRRRASAAPRLPACPAWLARCPCPAPGLAPARRCLGAQPLLQARLW